MPQANSKLTEPKQLVIVPSQGGFFSRSVLEHQRNLELQDRSAVTVVFVNSASSTQNPQEVRASIEPLIKACNADFIVLHAFERSVAETIMEYAHSVNANYVMTATHVLNGTSQEGPTIQAMYSCLEHYPVRVLCIYAALPKMT